MGHQRICGVYIPDKIGHGPNPHSCLGLVFRPGPHARPGRVRREKASARAGTEWNRLTAK